MASKDPTAPSSSSAPGRGYRLDGHFDQLFEQLNASLSEDHRLLAADIAVTNAHADMLERQGLLQAGDAEKIRAALQEIRIAFEAGKLDWQTHLEDIHMNLEHQLTLRLGDLGRRVHTGRSRNDQVAAGFRIYLRGELDQLLQVVRELRGILIERAQQEAATVMPGLTHLQPAQPVTLGHHLLAWNEMLERDCERMVDCRRRLNRSPLGAAALAGTLHQIDPEHTAAALEFEQPLRNSLDAVSDRDFAVELAFVCSLLAVHFSRFAEEVILWASPWFGFVRLPDAIASSSSIMPQKRNPDLAELVRGRTGRATGALNALLILLKGQPLAYNKDNQEDKYHTFAAMDNALACSKLWILLMQQVVFEHERMRHAASQGFSTATDLADRLVLTGMAFRDAHQLVGKVVSYAEQHQTDLAGLSESQWQEIDPCFVAAVTDGLSSEQSVQQRNHKGGTSPVQVRQAAQDASSRLDAEIQAL
ncbi:MAG: argininosuccinate lyase [Gammaproteobacteria bacterium]